MCGRYGRFSRKDRIEQILGTRIDGGDDLGVRYNVCPGTPDWIIKQPLGAIGPRFEQYEWGLLPAWRERQGHPAADKRPRRDGRGEADVPGPATAAPLCGADRRLL